MSEGGPPCRFRRSPRLEAAARWVPCAVIAVGVVLRVARWAAGRSLWLDEIFLANNILHRSMLGLARPLDYRQGAPVLFLWLEKVGVMVWGGSERGLRVVPLVAGCGALFLMWGVGRRLLGWWPGVVAVAILGVLEPAVYYSSEVKQYSVDLMVTLGILYVGVRYWRREWGAVALGAVGVVGMFLSHPAVLVLAGVGFALFVGGDRKVRRELLVVAGVWGMVLVGNWWWFLRQLSREAGLREYWANGFMPWSVEGALQWLGGAMVGLFGDYATMWLVMPGRLEGVAPVVGFMGAVMGVVQVGKAKGWGVALLLAGPVVVCLAAAGVHGYPFSGRLLLFLVPVVVLMMAGVFVGGGDRGLRWVGGILVITVMVGSVGREAVYLVRPPGREELRGVLEEVAKLRREGDLVYVYYGANAGYRYYAGGDRGVIWGRNRDEDFYAFEEDGRELEGKGRVWVVYSHVPDGSSRDVRLGEVLEREGRVVESVERRGAGAYLYLMGGG